MIKGFVIDYSTLEQLSALKDIFLMHKIFNSYV